MLATTKSPREAPLSVRGPGCARVLTGPSKFRLAAETPFGRHNQENHYVRGEI